MDADIASKLAQKVIDGEELTTNDETLFRACAAAVVPLRMLARVYLSSNWIPCECKDENAPF